MNIEKKHNYFYKTTNLVNGKYYYGIHSTNNLNDGYMGSGNSLTAAIKKYGKDNFVKEIIADYPTRKEASDHEKLIVTIELIKLNECYNLRTGGDNEFITPMELEIRKNINKIISNSKIGIPRTEETKQKLRTANTGRKHSQETIKKLKIANTGRKHTFEVIEKMKNKIVSNETREKLRQLNLGKKLSNEHVEKIRQKNIGKKISEETKQKISKAHKDKIVSNETRKKMSIAFTGRKHSEETKKKLSLMRKGQPGKFSKKCIINNILFNSIKSAAECFNLRSSHIIKRLKSEKIEWKDWQYVTESIN